MRRDGKFVNRWTGACRAVAILSALATSGSIEARAESRPATTPATARPAIVAAANPLAAEAGLAMLRRGGSAVDAMVAVQLALGVVEPQSSGIGGGALLLYWDETARHLRAFDGLARAPAKVTAGLMVDEAGETLSEPDRRRVGRSGRSVGAPGTMKLMWELHRTAGRLPWAELFAPAIDLAEGGFPLPPYLRRAITGSSFAPEAAAARVLFLDGMGQPPAPGTRMRNPDLAATLRLLAAAGVAPLYGGVLGRQIVEAVKTGPLPGHLTIDDLASYRMAEREPVCGWFRGRRVCAMPPPSFGGIAVLQILGMVDRKTNGPVGFDSLRTMHIYAEATRLAAIDRLAWVGDPDHVAVPSVALVSTGYVDGRAELIEEDRRLEAALPGAPDGLSADGADTFCTPPPTSTSQVAIADAAGNAISLTTTINLNFGSHVVAAGFPLNNVATNFARAPKPAMRSPNAMAPGKRPVTSMAPVIAFDASGQVEIVGGSAGGGEIVGYVAQSLLEMMANDRTPQEALAAPHVVVMCDQVGLEKGTDVAELRSAMEAIGHNVAARNLPSGLQFIRRVEGGWIGGADPRRDGAALGR